MCASCAGRYVSVSTPFGPSYPVYVTDNAADGHASPSPEHDSTLTMDATGTEHDFTVTMGDYSASVWHSDKGEWSVATTDGPVYQRGSRDAAIMLVAALALDHLATRAARRDAELTGDEVSTWSRTRLEGAQAERHDRPADLAILAAEIARRDQTPRAMRPTASDAAADYEATRLDLDQDESTRDNPNE